MSVRVGRVDMVDVVVLPDCVCGFDDVVDVDSVIAGYSD